MQDINIVIGDVHLGRNSNNLVIFQYTELFLKSAIMDTAVAELIRSNTPFSVTFMGDTFDSESLMSTFISSRISKYVKDLNNVDQCKSIYFLVGNHDTWTKKSNIDNASNIFIANSKVTIVYDKLVEVTPSGKTCCLVSHCADEAVFLELIKDDSSDYLYMHQEIEGFLYKGEDSFSDIKPIHLMKYERVINGHIHNPLIKGNITLTGSIEQCHFGEAGNVTGYWVMNHLLNDMPFFKNTVSPTYMKIQYVDIKDKDVDELSAMFNKKYVRIYCVNDEDVFSCSNQIKDVETAFSIKPIKILNKKDTAVLDEDIELKSISDSIEETAINLVDGLLDTEFKGFLVDEEIVTLTKASIENYHNKIK